MAIPVKSHLDFENVAKAINLPNPSSSQDAATKAYVDSAIEGLAWKDSCRVATQANISLASPGTTIDGVTMAANDRFLSKSQTLPEENGIYIWNGAAVAATRALDANTASELEQATTLIEEGTSAGSSYRQTSVNFTLGTGAVLWTLFGASVGPASETSAGIAEIATQAETDAGTDDARIVTPLKLANWAGRIRKYASTFGDGSATQYDIVHNFSSSDVLVNVFRVSDGAEILCDVARLNGSTVRLNFAAAPSSNSLRCVVSG